MKFCLHKFHISRLLQWTTPREGLGTAKLFVDVAGNDVTVNNKGGATYNNNKQSLKASCYKIDSNFAVIIQPQKSLTHSLMPLSSAKQFVKRTHGQSLCKCTSCKEKQFSRALLAILPIATWCRPSVVDGGDRNSAINKWWNWVGIKQYHNRNWQVGWHLSSFIANGHDWSQGTIDHTTDVGSEHHSSTNHLGLGLVVYNSWPIIALKSTPVLLGWLSDWAVKFA